MPLMGERICPRCQSPLSPTKQKTAVYCTRKCKTAASEQRRPKRDHRARYLRERELRLANAKAYAKRNPEVGRAAKRRRRAQKVNAGLYVVLQSDWRSMLHRYRNLCAYCEKNEATSVDHVIPLNKGGRHSIGNLLPACMTCNPSKSDKYLSEWKYGRR